MRMLSKYDVYRIRRIYAIRKAVGQTYETAVGGSLSPEKEKVKENAALPRVRRG